MKKFFFRCCYYASRLMMFILIVLKVIGFGVFHPRVIFNFLFGIVTEVAEFHKRCGGPLVNFDESTLSQNIRKKIFLSRSSFFHSGYGNIRPEEAQVMAALVDYLKPEAIFEIGTYNGFSTLHLAQNAPEGTQLYTLDLPLDRRDIHLHHDLLEAHKDIKNIELNRRKRLFHDEETGRRVVELFGDSMHFDFSPYYGKMDFIFIDANHSYVYVKSDTENALKLLSDRGVILWHDYDFIHPGVFRYLNELARSRRIYYIERTRWALYIKE